MRAAFIWFRVETDVILNMVLNPWVPFKPGTIFGGQVKTDFSSRTLFPHGGKFTAKEIPRIKQLDSRYINMSSLACRNSVCALLLM
jgi:hypothetical protein